MTDHSNEAVSAEVPEDAAKALDMLPGLIGALDEAIRAHVGKPLGFMLLLSLPGGVAHATNIKPTAAAMQFVKDFAATIEVNDGAANG